MQKKDIEKSDGLSELNKYRNSEQESRFFSYESAVANQEIIDEYFAELESEDFETIAKALTELKIIIEEDVTPITSAQFYVLLNIVKDSNNEILANLACCIIYAISHYPESLIEKIIPFDFVSCLEEMLPNNVLFTIIQSFITVRNGMAEYLSDYGFVDKLETFIGPESEFNSECLKIMRKLATKGVYRASFLPLLIAIIKETEDESLRIDAFKTFGVIVGNIEESRVEFLKHIPTFIEFIDAFPMLIDNIFFVFAGFAQSENEELVRSVLCDEIISRIIPMLDSEIKLHQVLVFLARLAKKNSIKHFLLENLELFNPIVSIAIEHARDHSEIIEVIKLISRVFCVEDAPYDADAFIDSGLFQAVVDYIPSSRHSEISEILKGLVAFVQVAEAQGKEVLEKIYDNETLAENLAQLNDSEISHERTKERLQLLLDFMQNEE